jgi:cytochrome c-type biogenesis protein CcmH
MIWILFAIIAVLVVGIIVLPVIRREPSAVADGLGVFQGQMAELKRDLELELISADEFRAAELDIKRRALAAAKPQPAQSGFDQVFRSTTIIGAGITSLLALSIYFSLGSPHLVGAGEPERDVVPAELQAVLDEIDALAAHMMNNPDNPEGWSLLSQAYLSMGRYREAIIALDNVIDLLPSSAEHHALLGQAHLLAENGSMSPAAREATARALELDPDHPRARFFAAEARFQDGDEAAAITAWQAQLARPDLDISYQRMIETRLRSVGVPLD